MVARHSILNSREGVLAIDLLVQTAKMDRKLQHKHVESSIAQRKQLSTILRGAVSGNRHGMRIIKPHHMIIGQWSARGQKEYATRLLRPDGSEFSVDLPLLNATLL